MVSKDKIDSVVQRIVANYKPEKIILFGSYANGKPTEDSDIDLLIIKDTEKYGYERDMEVMKLIRGCMLPVDLLVYTNQEIDKWKNVQTSFVNNVLKTGKMIYAREK